MLLLTALCLPLFAALGITLTSRWPNLREAVTLISAALLSITVFAIYMRFSDGAVFAVDIAEPLPGLMLRFEIEPLGMLLALVTSTLWFVTGIYAIGYMRKHKEQNQTRFYALFAIAIGSAYLKTF